MAKQIYRLPPCPAWDAAATEAWLEDMAARGLCLSRDGFFAGVGIFDRGAPRAMRFRLEAAALPTSLFSDNGGDPDPDAVELSACMGWQYYGSRGQFHIYGTDDPDAVELNTDPQVQALSLQKVRKRQRSRLLGLIFWLLLWPLCRIRFALLRAALTGGSWLLVLLEVVLLWPIADGLRELHALRTQARRLQTGEKPPHPRRRRHQALLHHGGTLLFLLCAALCLWGFWRQADPTRPAGVPLSDYTGSLPFPRMEDLTGSTDFVPMDMGQGWNTVREGSDPLAPVTISLKQVGSCGGFSGGLTVEYYELRSPFLARRLADEYMRLAKGGSHYDVLPLPDLGVDRADGYTDLFPTVVLVEGSRLLRVTLWQTGSSQIPLEDWTAAYARALLAAGS